MKTTLLFFSLIFANILFAQTTLIFEDFENNAVTFTAPIVGLFHDGSRDYFHIVPSSGPFIDGQGPINNIQGSNFFGANDLDGEGGPATQTIDWNGIDISTSTAITISAYFAEGNRLGGENWDADTSMRVEYRVDGGAYTSIFAIEAAQGANNVAPFVDLNFNGEGNDDGGPEITDVLT